MRTVRISLATVGLAAMVMANSTAANSITFIVGAWHVTLTDLGVLPGGRASRGLSINNVGRIVGLATDSTFALQRPFWDANSGAIVGFAQNFDPASTAVPVHVYGHGTNNLGQMAGASNDGAPNLFQHAVLWQNKDTPRWISASSARERRRTTARRTASTTSPMSSVTARSAH
jgi:uncharacterized membrane protein